MKNKAFLFAVVLFATLIFPTTSLAQFGPPEGFENMMQGGGDGQSSQGSQNMMQGGGQFGPPANMEELMNKGKEMQQKGFQMLKSKTRSMYKAVSRMESTIAKVEKAGYAVSQDILDSVANGKAAIDAIESAQSMDEAEEPLNDFNDFIDILDQNIESLNMLANYPKILKQAERTFTKLLKTFEKQKAKAEKGDLDLSGAINAIQIQIATIKAVYDQSQVEAKNGNSVEAFRLLEDEYFAPMEEVFQSVGMLQAASNIKKAIKGVEKGIAKADKIVKKYASKADLSVAEEKIDEAKAKLDELKTMIKDPNFEPEPAVDLLEALSNLRDDFESAIEDAVDINLTGKNSVDFFNMPMPAMPKDFTNSSGGNSEFDKIDMGDYGF